MTLLHNASTLAAMCGAASATASAARDRRIADTYYRSPRSNFNAASYMNYLRAPVPSRVPSSHGVGIHIHYQGQCPHHMTHGSSYAGGNLTLDGDSYGHPQDHRASPYAHHEGSSTSPCGCPRCYWRDFVSWPYSILWPVEFRMSYSPADPRLCLSDDTFLYLLYLVESNGSILRPTNIVVAYN
ncbi:hypothetical protein ANO14919_037650 [Xylariales sp. No.14919]|nr:hypothetical protein ANO14919_037650 [Xylariales sp. No.14919]